MLHDEHFYCQIGWQPCFSLLYIAAKAHGNIGRITMLLLHSSSGVHKHVLHIVEASWPCLEPQMGACACRGALLRITLLAAGFVIGESACYLKCCNPQTHIVTCMAAACLCMCKAG